MNSSRARACSLNCIVCWPRKSSVNFRDGMLGPYLRADSMWWLAGIFAVVGVIIFVITGFAAKQIYVRKQGYYETRATIGDKYISTASDSTNYYIHFRYQDRSGRFL